jgi:hypothetical protein
MMRWIHNVIKMSWLKKLADNPIAEPPVQTETPQVATPLPQPVSTAPAPKRKARIEVNQYERQFFVVSEDTFPIKDDLKRMGFRYFKNPSRWSLPLADAVFKRQEIENLNVDTSCMGDTTSAEPMPAASQEPVQPETPQQVAETIKKQNITLTQMRENVLEALRSGTESALTKVVMEEIDKLASIVDEEAKSEIVTAFLEFSSKFWHYSLGNQILIWAQRPDATYISGAAKWEAKGRKVVNDRPIAIWLPPQTSNKRLSRQQVEEISKLPPEQQTQALAEAQSAAGTFTRWMTTSVYDISDTIPIPGWKNKEGKGPFQPPQLRLDSNEKLDHVSTLVQATTDFVKRCGKTVDLDKVLSEELGGYATGTDVVVNKLYQGVNQFGVLAHEVAHIVLHWTEIAPKDKKAEAVNGKMDVAKEISETELVRSSEERNVKEIDAEATSYIVLKHYGYESKSAPQYLALWKATSKDLKDRRNNIAAAVTIIINNIDMEIGKTKEQDAVPVASALTRWLLSNCKFSARK